MSVEGNVCGECGHRSISAKGWIVIRRLGRWRIELEWELRGALPGSPALACGLPCALKIVSKEISE